MLHFPIDFIFYARYTNRKGGEKMNARLKELRNALNMTQQEFADKLNIKRGTIANYEIGRNEPIDAVISLICKEFNVNENWLRTGEGEMFAEVPAEDEYFKAVTQISKSNDKLAMQAIIEYWKLDDVSKETLRNYIYKIAEKSRE